jgi:transcription elongation factor Elf1
MIIIFGTRSVVRDEDRPGGGPRQCPNCGHVALFKTRRARSFIHIFWIPLIPLGGGQAVLECGNCKARFQVEG